MTRRMLIMLAVLGAMLVLTAGWTYQYMMAGRSSAVAASDELADGLSMMAQIDQISRQPRLAADREKLSTETTSLIEAAAEAAGIDKGASLRRFSYPAPRRLGNSAYKEMSTQVQLQSVSMKQLVDLASAPSLQEAVLNVESIRISAPRESDDADNWNAELVLTYLVYDPLPAGK